MGERVALAHSLENVTFKTITQDSPNVPKEFQPFLPSGSIVIGKPQFQTCAVVLSSPEMLDKQYGAEIDNHDAVLRFNFAPSSVEFQQYVGSKTTHRLLNAEAAKVIEGTNKTADLQRDLPHHMVNINDHEVFMVWGSDLQGVSELLERRHAKGLSTHVLDDHTVSSLGKWISENELLVKHVDLQNDYIRPSSGSIGMLMMLHLCSAIDLYGEPLSTTTDKSWHYWHNSTGGQRATSNKWHNTLSAEHVLMHMLSTTPKNEFHLTGRLRIPGFHANVA